MRGERENCFRTLFCLAKFSSSRSLEQLITKQPIVVAAGECPLFNAGHTLALPRVAISRRTLKDEDIGHAVSFIKRLWKR